MFELRAVHRWVLMSGAVRIAGAGKRLVLGGLWIANVFWRSSTYALMKHGEADVTSAEKQTISRCSKRVVFASEVKDTQLGISRQPSRGGKVPS